MTARSFLLLLVILAAALAPWVLIPPLPGPHPRDPRPPAGLDDLGRFSITTAAVHGDATYLLLAEQRIFLDGYLETPDHARGYRRWFYVAESRPGRFRVTPIDCIASGPADEDFPATSAALDADATRVRAFIVYRGYVMLWGADGATYTLDPGTLALRSKEPVFVNKNWGWTPYFDGEAVAHFSHSNKNEYRDMRRIGPANADDFRKRQLAFMRERSRGLVPGRQQEIVARLKREAAAPVDARPGAP